MTDRPQDAPARILMARAVGAEDWQPLPAGHSMSMGYSECAAYVPEAALEAARADERRELLDEAAEIAYQFVLNSGDPDKAAAAIRALAERPEADG